MNDKLLALRVFLRVAHTGIFSAAGRELDLSQPSVSRIIAALESDVGEALVIRTTRAVTLTEVGDDYLARIEPILAALEEADHDARGSAELRGSLRVAMPQSFGVREVIPLLPEFLARHPALSLFWTSPHSPGKPIDRVEAVVGCRSGQDATFAPASEIAVRLHGPLPPS